MNTLENKNVVVDYKGISEWVNPVEQDTLTTEHHYKVWAREYFRGNKHNEAQLVQLHADFKSHVDDTNTTINKYCEQSLEFINTCNDAEAIIDTLNDTVSLAITEATEDRVIIRKHKRTYISLAFLIFIGWAILIATADWC
jgi:hypothetical protein